MSSLQSSWTKKLPDLPHELARSKSLSALFLPALHDRHSPFLQHIPYPETLFFLYLPVVLRSRVVQQGEEKSLGEFSDITFGVSLRVTLFLMTGVCKYTVFVSQVCQHICHSPLYVRYSKVLQLVWRQSACKDNNLLIFIHYGWVIIHVVKWLCQV